MHIELTVIAGDQESYNISAACSSQKIPSNKHSSSNIFTRKFFKGASEASY